MKYEFLFIIKLTVMLLSLSFIGCWSMYIYNSKIA